jgi:hypothetical protein
LKGDADIAFKSYFSKHSYFENFLDKIPSDFLRLLVKLLNFDWKQRPSAENILAQDEWVQKWLN